MNGKFDVEEFKNIVSEYDDKSNSSFTIDDIIKNYSDKPEAIDYTVKDIEKSLNNDKNSIDQEVVRPAGISLTGAFEAIKSEKEEIKEKVIENIDSETDITINKKSVEITAEIENKRFFNTETFNSIKNGDDSLKNTMVSFTKGEEEQDDGEADDMHFKPHEPTEEIEDFEKPDERDDVILDLKKLCSSASVKSVITFVLMCVCGLMFFISRYNVSIPGLSIQANTTVYFVVALSVCLIASIVNINTIISGACGIVKMKFNHNTMLFMIFIFNTIVDLMYIFSSNPNIVYVSFDFIYLILLFVNIYSKSLLAKNTLKNFKVVSSDGMKTVVDKPQQEEISNDIILETGASGDIIYASKSNFVADFIHNSFKDFEILDKKSITSTLCSIFVLAFTVVIYIITDSFLNAFVYTTGALCATTPILSTYAFCVPIIKNGRKIRKNGGVVVGSSSAYALSDAQTLIVDDSDVFNVALNGIRVYGDTSVDDAIIYLNSLYRIVGGPLSSLFGKMLSEDIASLPRVDDIYYHESMGYSALIHSKILVSGNKALMDHFGIEVDDSEFELIYQQKSKSVLFVAFDGKLIGVFLLSYAFSHGVKKAFEIFESDQINVAIAERDANINRNLLFTGFSPKDRSLFDIMKFRTSRNCFDKFVIKAKTSSLLASNTGLKGVASALHGCKSMLFAIKANNVIKTISTTMGLALITFLLLFSDPGAALSTHILVYQFLWSLPIFFVSMFSK